MVARRFLTCCVCRESGCSRGRTKGRNARRGKVMTWRHGTAEGIPEGPCGASEGAEEQEAKERVN